MMFGVLGLRSSWGLGRRGEGYLKRMLPINPTHSIERGFLVKVSFRNKSSVIQGY